MTYHFTPLDSEMSIHIYQQFEAGPKGFMDECYNVLGLIDNHGHKIQTFTHAIRFLVETGNFLIWDSEIRDFLITIRDEFGGYLPYVRTSKPIEQWQPETVRRFYCDMVVRSGIKYLDMIRKMYVVNYDGMKY